MFDVALSSAGAQIVKVTSSDEKYPADNIIDGQQETFWCSTGLYPQEFVISFASVMDINTIRLNSYNIKKLCIERSVSNEPTDFEPLQELELEATDGQLQSEELTYQQTTAQHMKFVIQSGHDHFVSVHKLHIDGQALRR